MSETMKGSVTRLADEYGSTRRRTQRVKIAIPVTVRIPRANASFYEEFTETVVVNAHGCLARLAVSLEQGQQIHIINSKSADEQACTVVWIGKFSEGKTEVGLEFSEPAPRFWRITFPPENWNPADRKLPTAPAMPQPSTSK
jgi:PilZ domain-containing protein